MAVRVAINGFGRIGRLAFRQMFGAEGYAGVQMNQELDGLRQEYILFQNGEDIFLIELAVFTGDEGQEGLLQVMLDTFTVF